MNLLIFLLCAVGLWLLATARCPGVYRPAALALRKRAPKALTGTEVLLDGLAERLAPLVDLDPIREARLAENLKSLGRSETPRAFQAHALARALLLSAALLWAVVFSLPLGVMLIAVTGAAVYAAQGKTLEREIDRRRQTIERELPQFASTIRQSLNSTHDVVAVLSTYRKVCGPVLRGEIDRTLNDMVTGNPERALKALEGRVASAKLGQITRGLVAVLRGDDQRLYFDMLSAEFRKAQNEEVAKALLKRPDELNPYLGLMFACFVLMICASLGAYLAQQMGTFF